MAQICTKIWFSCIRHHMTNFLRRLFALKFDTPRRLVDLEILMTFLCKNSDS